MSSLTNAYEVQQEIIGKEVLYLFLSRGRKSIIKIVQYILTETLSGQDVYNLGFGDYDFENERIKDDILTSNGDVYKVFQTVLSTVPLFLNQRPESIVLVRGSDSTLQYQEQCRQTCTKHCEQDCKNADRRIRLYQSYVNRNHTELVKEYQFLGGNVDINGGWFIIEDYKKANFYDGVFVSKRKIPL